MGICFPIIIASEPHQTRHHRGSHAPERAPTRWPATAAPRFHSRLIDWGAQSRLAKIPGEFLFPVWPRSIANLAHTVMCFEGISELAATRDPERGAALDGQAKSSALPGFFVLRLRHAAGVFQPGCRCVRKAGEALLAAYAR